jgi:pimeloyl-ACP methyl ester carboxylesterase
LITCGGRCWKRTLGVVAGVLLSLAAAAPALAGQDAGSGRECSDVQVPVALAKGQPADERIYGKLCIPSGHSPDTIQLLVHGLVYTGGYWEFPDPRGGTDRYNYASAANRAGFATLAIDRIGSGRSSHPLSTKITLESNAFAVHQVVQAIRRGQIAAPGGEQFRKVVYVGHSYGTIVGWNLATNYGEGLDAVVFTAAAHGLTVTDPLLALPSLYPAALDPKFAGDGLDPGYLTTLPGTRDEFLYEPAQFDPAVVEFDEKTKSTSTATEAATGVLSLNRPLNVRVPTLLVDGDLDSQVCKENFDAVPAVTGGGAGAVGDLLAPFEDTTLEQSEVTGFQLGGADCSSPEALIEDERAQLGPRVPSVDAFILPGAPHDLNQALNAQVYFTAVNHWIAATLGS